MPLTCTPLEAVHSRVGMGIGIAIAIGHRELKLKADSDSRLRYRCRFRFRMLMFFERRKGSYNLFLCSTPVPRRWSGMRFSPSAQSQRIPNTHHRPPSFQSWMLLMPRAKGAWFMARVLA